MDIHKTVQLGKKYSKKELSEIFDEINISRVREGIYNLNENNTFFFVDLEKEGKEKKFHFNDFFDGEYFHWDSQSTQHLNSPKIQEIIKGTRVPHLFARIRQKVKSKSQPFVYCGRLKYIEFEKNTSKPIHMIYLSVDYDNFTENQDLIEIYLWRPERTGKTTTSKISKRSEVTNERKSKYKKPNSTERKGLVTSRVGQGYYRQQLLDKWGGRCPITNCDIKEILISSHIVRWAESNDEERLDIDNGILLSPNIDSLFDKYLVLFPIKVMWTD